MINSTSTREREREILYIFIFIYIYIYTHTYIHTYIYIYIYTCIYTHRYCCIVSGSSPRSATRMPATCAATRRSSGSTPCCQIMNSTISITILVLQYYYYSKLYCTILLLVLVLFRYDYQTILYYTTLHYTILCTTILLLLLSLYYTILGHPRGRQHADAPAPPEERRARRPRQRGIAIHHKLIRHKVTQQYVISTKLISSIGGISSSSSSSSIVSIISSISSIISIVRSIDNLLVVSPSEDGELPADLADEHGCETAAELIRKHVAQVVLSLLLLSSSLL